MAEPRIQTRIPEDLAEWLADRRERTLADAGESTAEGWQAVGLTLLPDPPSNTTS